MSEITKDTSNVLFKEIKQIIEENKIYLAKTVNTTLSATYWHIGKKIKLVVLKDKRAEYGKQVIINLSKKLTLEYGKGWSKQQLQHCLRFAETFADFEIVSTL